MTSLRKLQNLYPKILYPAHGPHFPDPASSHAKIAEYIQHRLDREQQIVDILTQKHADKDGQPVRAEKIVQEIYRDLGEQVWKIALGPVKSHLVKLERDGKVKRVGNGTGTSWVLF